MKKFLVSSSSTFTLGEAKLKGDVEEEKKMPRSVEEDFLQTLLFSSSTDLVLGGDVGDGRSDGGPLDDGAKEG